MANLCFALLCARNKNERNPLNFQVVFWGQEIGKESKLNRPDFNGMDHSARCEKGKVWAGGETTPQSRCKKVDVAGEGKQQHWQDRNTLILRILIWSCAPLLVFSFNFKKIYCFKKTKKKCQRGWFFWIFFEYLQNLAFKKIYVVFCEKNIL